MKLSKVMVALAAAGAIGIGSAYAAGIFPDYPVVGGATYCAGNTQSVSGTYTGSQTGCPNQVPAGPTIVTGSEQIPADTRLSSGANPQTVLIPMASLNALPITVSAANLTGNNLVSAANTSGGIYLTGTGAISALNVTLPLAPIDGQQYVVSSNRSITAVVITGTNAVNTIAGNSAPTALTASTTLPQGYKFIYNAATTSWFKLQ